MTTLTNSVPSFDVLLDKMIQEKSYDFEGIGSMMQPKTSWAWNSKDLANSWKVFTDPPEGEGMTVLA